MLRILVNWLIPGDILFLVVTSALGAAMLYAGERLRRVGRTLLALIATFYLMTSTRVGADLYLAPLYRYESAIERAADAQGATAVVMLNPGADSYRARGLLVTSVAREAALRIIETARVYRLLGNPPVIVMGGFAELTDRPTLGAIMAKALTELGVPSDRVIIEPLSRNTRQHVENLRPYLDKLGVRRFVLVTSPTHMWRSAAAFRAGGYDFVTSSAARDSDLPDYFDSAFVPHKKNLQRIAIGSHEYLGLFYYWWHGWI